MSSSAQFLNGLNNWVPSDKPTREDFVGDNKNLDQNAMWKSQYDATDSVITAGGIPAFVSGSAVAKLKTPRTISLTGKVTGSASFDGSANVSIATALSSLAKADIGLGYVDNVKQMPVAGGTFTGTVYAKQSNVNVSCIHTDAILNSAGAMVSTYALLFYRK